MNTIFNLLGVMFGWFVLAIGGLIWFTIELIKATIKVGIAFLGVFMILGFMFKFAARKL